MGVIPPHVRRERRDHKDGHPCLGNMGGKITSIMLITTLLIPIASAAPPPGSPEVENTICDTNSTPGGICDDYRSSLDPTIGDHWSQITVLLTMESASEITIEVFMSLHELSRIDLGLQQLELGGDSTDQDGIPADFIRNFFNEQTSSGETVSERMFSQVDDMVLNALGDNFQSIGIPVTNTVSTIPRITTDDLECSADSSVDSVDEEETRVNDPFWPPICVRSALAVTINSTSIGMDETRGNLDRTMLGLLIMGAEVNLNFDLMVDDGQTMEMALIPPDYSDVFDTQRGTTQEIHQSTEGQEQRIAVVSLDRTQAEPSPPVSLTLDATIRHLPGDTQTVNLTETPKKGISANLIIDAEDTSRAGFGLEISVHYLDSQTLESWSVDLEQEGVKIPWITSDGLRLLDEETDIGLDSLLEGLPMEEISDTLSEILGIEVQLGTPFFSPTDESGGLQYTHTQGSLCAETSPNRYCLSGEGAMNSSIPVYISAYSSPSSIEISDIFQQLIEKSDFYAQNIDTSTFSDQDFARLLSVLRIDLSDNFDWMTRGLNEAIPNSELSVEMQLPNWIASESETPDILTLESDSENQNIAITGTRPFDWGHPICMETTQCTDESWDVICKSNQPTCISLTIDLDIEQISLRELSSSLTLDFDMHVTLDIYRVDVDLGIDGIETSPIPSDIIRHIITMGDKVEGGILNGSDLKRIDSPFPADNHPIDLDISNKGMRDLADEMTNRMRLQLLDYSNADHPEIELVGVGSVTPKMDLSMTPLSLEIEDSDPLDTPYLTDTNPIKVGVSVENAKFRITLVEDEVSIKISKKNTIDSLITYVKASVSPDFSSSGVGPFAFDFRVTPIDEKTDFGTIRPVLIEKITLPRGVILTEFESSLSRGYLEKSGDRETLVYLTPHYECEPNTDETPCQPITDIVTLSIMVEWSLIVRELIPYFLAMLTLIGILVWRRRRKKIIKRRLQARKLENKTMEWIESIP